MTDVVLCLCQTAGFGGKEVLLAGGECLLYDVAM